MKITKHNFSFKFSLKYIFTGLNHIPENVLLLF